MPSVDTGRAGGRRSMTSCPGWSAWSASSSTTVCSWAAVRPPRLLRQPADERRHHVLVRWGHARGRRVRDTDGGLWIVPWRARCTGCGVTHVLLPVVLLVRRADTAAVIGAGLTAKATGAGHRLIAALLGRPPEPVRAVFTRWCRDLAPTQCCPGRPGRHGPTRLPRSWPRLRRSRPGSVSARCRPGRPPPRVAPDSDREADHRYRSKHLRCCRCPNVTYPV